MELKMRLGENRGRNTNGGKNMEMFIYSVLYFRSEVQWCIFQVAWVRAEDQTILSLHTKVVTHNSRISVTHDSQRTWQIRIRQLKESDRGCYMCQINTSVLKIQQGCIDVNGKFFLSYYIKWGAKIHVEVCCFSRFTRYRARQKKMDMRS